MQYSCCPENRLKWLLARLVAQRALRQPCARPSSHQRQQMQAAFRDAPAPFSGSRLVQPVGEESHCAGKQVIKKNLPALHRYTNIGSGSSRTSKCCATSCWMAAASAAISLPLAPPRLTSTSACFSYTPAAPADFPFQPQRSISQPAASFTLPSACG